MERYAARFGAGNAVAFRSFFAGKTGKLYAVELAPPLGANDEALMEAAHLLEQIPEANSSYVFCNPKTGTTYKLHEFYYLHKKILKQAKLPWVAFRDLQRQCMEVGI